MARDDIPRTKGPDDKGGPGDDRVPDGPPGGGSPSVIYYGYCSSPSHDGTWTGPDRDLSLDAEYDCREHNRQCDTQGAFVTSRAVIIAT